MLVLRHFNGVNVHASVLSTDQFCQHCPLEALPLGLESRVSLCRRNCKLCQVRVVERKREWEAKLGKQGFYYSACHLPHLKPGSRDWSFCTHHSGSWNARRAMLNLVEVKNTAPFQASIWQEKPSSGFRKHSSLKRAYKGNFKGWRQVTERWRGSKRFIKGDICQEIL